MPDCFSLPAKAGGLKREDKTYGCFYCFQQNIVATDIQEYTGDSSPEPICPYCGIDSLLPDADMGALLYRHVMSFHVDTD